MKLYIIFLLYIKVLFIINEIIIISFVNDLTKLYEMTSLILF